MANMPVKMPNPNYHHPSNIDLYRKAREKHEDGELFDSIGERREARRTFKHAGELFEESGNRAR